MRSQLSRRNHRGTLIVRAFAPVVLLATGAAVNAAPPPPAKWATIQRLANPTRDGDTRLEVAFSARVRNAPAFAVDNQEVTVRDDGLFPDTTKGDGIFSAAITVNLEELRQSSDALAKAAAKGGKALVFAPRQVTGSQSMSQIDMGAFLAGRPIQIFPLGGGSAANVNADASLMITDVGVVEDPSRTFDPCTGLGTPMGSWTFGRLMTEMANQSQTGIAPSHFVRRWLRHWQLNQTINFDVVPQRPAIQSQIIAPWETASGGPGSPLDLALAPFRLLAVVNRIDLRENAAYGGGSAGEARFVFGALGPGCTILPFTVIFEYGIKKSGCRAVKAWGQQWADLDTLVIGSPAYNAALQAITDQFVPAGSDPFALPNQSSLNQLRTNEIALGSPWELREFQLAESGSDVGHLREVTVKQTPDFAHNNTATVASYVSANAAAVLAGTHVVPLDFPPAAPAPFLGGAAPTPGGMFWDGPPPAGSSLPTDQRHMFSLATCNGCHAGETSTFFTHVANRAAGAPAALSGFLTGISVTDPALGAPSRSFDDLDRRAQDLDTLLNSSCLIAVFQPPLLMAH